LAADVDAREGRAAMHVNLGSILRATAGQQGDQVVIRFGDRAITYAELERAASGIAASLRARGLAPGDKIALMVPNVPEFTMAYFGILYAGCTVVPINVLLSGEEVQYHLEDSDAKLLVAHSFFRAPPWRRPSRWTRYTPRRPSTRP
jgi:long-chain acyl-CoA synthetase